MPAEHDKLSSCLRFVFYAAVTFLIATAAIAGIDLTKTVQGSGTLFGSSYGDSVRGIVGLVTYGGPILFGVGAIFALVGALPGTTGGFKACVECLERVKAGATRCPIAARIFSKRSKRTRNLTGWTR